VYAAQPETFYQIFNRVLSNTDIATGKLSENGYSSKGPQSSFNIKNALPPSRPFECSTWQAGLGCTQNQIDALDDGSVLVEEYIIVKPEADPSSDF
jgi:hypothetical protein